MVISVVLMYLITAVGVNAATEDAFEDKGVSRNSEETRKKKLIKQLRRMFIHLDDDGSGEITLDELEFLTRTTRICFPLV